MGNFKEDIARCEAFVFDVDGVMTDGGIIPTPDGDFIRRYNAKDGYALAYAIKIGYKVCIITGGRGRTLENRLRMLGIDHFYVDCMDKITAIREYMAGQGLDPANVIYMGDDIPDLDCMREVGLPVCPADAAAEVIEASRYVSEFRGGEGAVRDIVEQVLRARGAWARDSQGVTPSSRAASRYGGPEATRCPSRPTKRRGRLSLLSLKEGETMRGFRLKFVSLPGYKPPSCSKNWPNKLPSTASAPSS